jgi:hypothetical protein
MKDISYTMTNTSALKHTIKSYPALLALLSITTIIASLCLLFEPRWSSNDDAAISMIAHGYGLAAYGSPHLIFSNVLWGYLVRAIPSVNDVLGYSIATLGVLLIVGWAILYFLLRLGIRYFVGLFAIALIIARPTIFPQYTINAGLLTVASIIGWQVYVRVGGTKNLVFACLLAFFGYLIRDKEFLLVFAVALPLLPWRELRKQRQIQIAFLLLGVAIASATAFDRWSYSGSEWQRFLEVSPDWTPVADFVDYGAGRHLKQHPEIMAHQNYSPNDIDLLSDWFFVDPKIANPKPLNAMLGELNSISTLQDGRLKAGLASIKALFDAALLPLTLSALVLFLIVPRRAVALAWALCLAALFVIGVMGRPGISRIYAPLLSLLIIAPLIIGECKVRLRQWLAGVTLFVGCIGNAYLFIPHALASKQWVQQVKKDISGLPNETMVTWGQSFPFELVFPLFAHDLNTRNIKFYGLDFFTHAPFSIASREQTAERGILRRLQTAGGVPILASPNQIGKLRIYCNEHLNGRLYEMPRYQTSWLVLRQVRCEPNT